MPKLQVATNAPNSDEAEVLRRLSGSDIVEVIHGAGFRFASTIESLDHVMPNGKAFGECTMEELDIFGEFFAGNITVEDLDREGCLSASWLFGYTALSIRKDAEG
jgi:hypothetical protein